MAGRKGTEGAHVPKPKLTRLITSHAARPLQTQQQHHGQGWQGHGIVRQAPQQVARGVPAVRPSQHAPPEGRVLGVWVPGGADAPLQLGLQGAASQDDWHGQDALHASRRPPF